MDGRYALLIDGGFLTKILRNKNGHYPQSSEILAECARIAAHPRIDGFSLLRQYFYDAPPSQKSVSNPVDGHRIDLGKTPLAKESQSLQDQLELSEDFALRRGETVVHGWKLGSAATRDIQKTPRHPEAKDFVPDIKQKGVDLRIGLDIARLSLRAMVDVIVVIAGDSDLVPAFKFARREGIRIYLDHLGQPVNRELKAHVDAVL